MSSDIRKLVSVIGGAAIFAVCIYGSYLPMRKSAAYITALRNLDSVKQLDDFKATLDTPLQMTSPIGQEELVRNTGSTVQDLIYRYGKDRPDVGAAVLKYVGDYFEPIIKSKRGLSFTQNLYLLGLVNQLMYGNTRDPKYLDESRRYYEWGLSLSPTRPQFLYGLFDVYRNQKDVEAAKKIAATILKQWPEDARVKEGLEAFLAVQAASLSMPLSSSSPTPLPSPSSSPPKK